MNKTCFICRDYIYWGEIITVEPECYRLKNCYIIYDTGRWKDPEWKTAEFLGNWNVRKSSVESWGIPAKVLPGEGTYLPVAGKTCNIKQIASNSNGNLLADGQDD